MNTLHVTVPPGTQGMRLARDLDAPRELVFQAMTDRALIPLWWGPGRYTTAVAELDPRRGGTWRYVSADEAGNEFAFRGVFHEVIADERIVQTFEFEPAAGHVSMETLTLTDLPGGRTSVTVDAVYQSVAARDAMVASGMEGGAAQTYDRLEALLASRLAAADPSADKGGAA